MPGSKFTLEGSDSFVRSILSTSTVHHHFLFNGFIRTYRCHLENVLLWIWEQIIDFLGVHQKDPPLLREPVKVAKLGPRALGQIDSL